MLACVRYSLFLAGVICARAEAPEQIKWFCCVVFCCASFLFFLFFVSCFLAVASAAVLPAWPGVSVAATATAIAAADMPWHALYCKYFLCVQEIPLQLLPSRNRMRLVLCKDHPHLHACRRLLSIAAILLLLLGVGSGLPVSENERALAEKLLHPPPLSATETQRP